MAQPEVEYLGDTDIPLTEATVDQMVAELAGEDGWWHEVDGEEISKVLHDMIVEAGVPKATAFGWVATVAGAIHNEHGY